MTPGFTGVKGIIREYHEKLYANIINKLLETCNPPALSHKETGNLNRPMTSKETESVIKNLPTKDGFSG